MSLILDEEQNFYEILEVKRDASPAEIRSAYMRARSSWKKDNVAFYSIFSEADTERLLRRIEEAYQTLSHPERRREYDRKNGITHLNANERTDAGVTLSPAGKGKKSDPFDSGMDAPMDLGGSESDLLIPPSTDFAPAPLVSPGPGRSQTDSTETSRPATETMSRRSPLLESIARGVMENEAAQAASENASTQGSTPPALPFDEEWRGQTLRRARENQGITVEELASHTKISKIYITAIEEEHLEKLPAPVFLRGFLITIARRLKLPQDQVSTAWMKRVSSARPH
jgi:curved DNA-binding protein CbpA